MTPQAKMSARVAAHDWSKTPLGPRQHWPQSLKTAVDLCLDSDLPMFVWWGPELINIYNDAYAPVLGKRHPEALGRPAQALWSEIWPLIGEGVAQVMNGQAVLKHEVPLILERNGYPEETWFTYSHSPIRDESGQVRGLFQVCFDETERVTAERHNKHLEDQARNILDSMSDGYFMLDREWRYTYSNRQNCELMGKQPGELLGKVLWEVYPGVIGSVFEPVYRAAMAGTAGSITQFFADHQRWYELRVHPGAGGISAYVRDVSAQVKAEEALRDSTALLRGISDSTGDVIYAKDRAGRLRYANPATLALIGKPLAEVIGRTDLELLQDKEAARMVAANDRRIMEQGREEDLEERVPLPDGTQRVWLSKKMPDRDAEGNVIGLLGVSRDITEQKRAWDRTNRLYAVVAALSNAMTPEEVAAIAVEQGIAAVGATAGSLALLDADGKQLELVGSTGFTQSIQQWSRFPVDAPVPLATSVRTGQPVFLESAEERAARFPAVLSLSADLVTQASACLPLLIGGRAIGALGLSFDRPGGFSTEDRDFLASLAQQCSQSLDRAWLFAAERRARNDAERASTMKDEFLATLSHELRTPLNAILGWSTVLSRRIPADSDLRAGLEKIQRNAQAQTRIVEDLLDMSRIVSGNLRLEVSRLDLTQVLQAALDTVRPAAEAKGVRLQTVLDSQGGPVSGDPGRLQQVFWNLLNNAVKFTPRGGQVQLTMERVHSHVEIRIADTGEGITSAFLPHVFDRFRQADGSTTRRHGGLGLGLAIVKQLVELHGGNIRATSPGEGQGATFTTELPLAVLHAEPLEIKDLERRVAVAPVHEDLELRLDGLRILVVDDEPDARALVRDLLEDRAAVVRLAGSAAEAMELLMLERPDVLISDIGMPGEDGYGFIKRVRALGSVGNIPAVALTAYARVEDRVKAIRAGFHSHVVKPVEASELIAVVASLAGRVG
jgi:PAS domain S-box-containing protein